MKTLHIPINHNVNGTVEVRFKVLFIDPKSRYQRWWWEPEFFSAEQAIQYLRKHRLAYIRHEIYRVETTTVSREVLVHSSAKNKRAVKRKSPNVV